MTEQTELAGWLYPEEAPEAKQEVIEMDRIVDGEIGPEPTAQFIESVNRYGVLASIVVREEKEGNRKVYRIIDGRRRYRAAKAVGLDRLKANVYPPGMEFAAAMTVITNNLRSNNPAAEVEAIMELLQGGAGAREIARATGLSIGTVNKRLRLLDLPKPLFDGLRDGKIAVSTAEAATRLPVPYQKELVRKFKKEKKLVGSDVKEVRTVQIGKSAEQLGGLLPEVERPWASEVEVGLRELRKLIPEGETDLLDLIGEAIEVSGQK